MIKKVILEGKFSTNKLFKGALFVSRFLGSTLGPRGRNVIIQKAYSAPEIVNDAGTIARHIVLSDPTEDLGAQTMIEATMKTNDRAGDARTTTAVLGGRLLETTIEKIDKQKGGSLGGESIADVISISREILDEKEKIIEKLKSPKHSRKLKKGELKNVVSTSIGRIYPEYVDPIAEMVEKVGVNGYVSVEDNYGTKYGVETTLIEGMRFIGSYASLSMVTDIKTKESKYENPLILVTNHRLGSVSEINDLTQKQMNGEGKRYLVVIAEGYEKDFLININQYYRTAAEAIIEGKPDIYFRILCVKAPSLTTDQFEDVAVFCDAKFIDKNKNQEVSKATLNDLGTAKKVIVDEDETQILFGRGNIKERLEILNAELEREKDSAFKEQLKRRIGALTSGFGIIRVGASTETERGYIKKKITDAVNSAKGALEEGVVISCDSKQGGGGGIALSEIADELGIKSIAYEALKKPNSIITQSTNGEKIPITVMDSLKSTRLAVENSFSVIAGLITLEGSIADVRETLWDKLETALAPKDNEDFRADENQELKYRT